MGDEGAVDVPSPPAAKRLKRVAEVVMVLSAMAEMRGGRDPTPVERAMAAEARESLTGLCERFKPKDLFPREAVRAVVEDLGLNKDAGMGFRPPRATIAERILQTKRKLEVPKEVPTNQYYPSQHVPGAFGASTRRSHMNDRKNDTVSGPLSAIPRTEALQRRHNGMAHLAQSRAHPQVHHDQRDKILDHTSVKSTSAPHGVSSTRPAQSSDVKQPVVQSRPTNLLIGLPAPQGITFVPAQSIFSGHADISKKVQKIIEGLRDPTYPSWTPPSSDYMNKPLICQSCNIVVTDVDSLLICDACERGTHLTCLEANGTKVEVPKAEWHCQKCLAISHGKALPPKYGKVTRTAGAPKAVTSVQKENSQLKDDQKKTVPNGTVTRQPNSGPSVNSGNLKNVQTVLNNPKERAVVPSAVVPSAVAPSTVAPSAVAPSAVVPSAVAPSAVVLATAAPSAVVPAAVAPSAGTGAKIENHHSQNGQSVETVNSSEPKETLGGKERASPQQDQGDKDSNQVNGIAASEKPTDPEVCWVGDAGEVIDGKSYYSSCCIDKITYKLQDHVLVSSDGERFIPSKIKSLWESKDPGSKYAVVNPYYLPSDLPESVSCSSGGVEDNEVYASDNKETVSISLISGPCEVLTSARFQEENEKRLQLAGSNDNSPPIFLCRWKYDDTNGILRPLTN